MGGDLSAAPSTDAKPTFVVSALRDAAETAAPLEQLQLIKGWIDASGAMRNEVLPVAKAQSANGAASLCAVYRDESFSASQPTYYYLRAVQVPTKRWSHYDCERLPAEERPAVCTDGSVSHDIQEMAWSSPIWFRPSD